MEGDAGSRKATPEHGYTLKVFEKEVTGGLYFPREAEGVEIQAQGKDEF